jgi:transcriptional regulator with XRE-family HTH domain
MKIDIAKFRKQKGWSQKEAAARLGLSLSGYTHIEAGRRRVSDARIRKIADVFGISPNELFGEVEDAAPQHEPSVGKIRVAGSVAAGVWLDDGDFDHNDVMEIPVVLGDYSEVEQFAYRVIGDSMDLAGFVDGGYVVAIDYEVARLTPRTGDYVIVDRHHSGRVERTVKYLRLLDDEFHLEPQSSNPKHQAIVIPRIEGLAHWDADDRSVAITGLVIGYYRPLVGRR